jgi:hypothetical protein
LWMGTQAGPMMLEGPPPGGTLPGLVGLGSEAAVPVYVVVQLGNVYVVVQVDRPVEPVGGKMPGEIEVPVGTCFRVVGVVKMGVEEEDVAVVLLDEVLVVEDLLVDEEIVVAILALQFFDIKSPTSWRWDAAHDEPTQDLTFP